MCVLHSGEPSRPDSTPVQRGSPKAGEAFLGPPGTGKSHLATALGVAPVKAGRRVYRATLAELIEALGRAEREGRLIEKIRFLSRSSLLIVDEIGYLPITPGGANLFFQLVNARYEKGAMILCETILEARNASEAVPHSVQRIDSPIVRAHHCAVGARGASGPGSRPLEGWLLDQDPSARQWPRPAPEGRPQRGPDLGLQGLRRPDGLRSAAPKALIADRGQDLNAVRKQGGTPVIPARRNRTAPEPISALVYALRNRIERCINHVKNARRHPLGQGLHKVSRLHRDLFRTPLGRDVSTRPKPRP
jgi:hypothetical protein